MVALEAAPLLMPALEPCPHCGSSCAPTAEAHLLFCTGCNIRFVSTNATQISLHSRRASGKERVNSVITITPEFAARYRLGTVLGTGAMGQVFDSVQIESGRRCAVKFLTRLGEPEILSRFLQEGRVLARMDCENVVRVLDSGELQSHPYLVTELLEGGTLRARLRATGRIELEGAMKVARECLNALAACHAAGVIHRDVKPENVMFGGDGRALLVDFGIAKAYGEATHQTRAGVMIGTPRYMPPELLRGLPATTACDIYSLACVLYEMITGRPPFNQLALAELVPHIMNEPPPSMCETVPEVPDWLDQLVQQALSKSVEDRPASAAEFARALEGPPPEEEPPPMEPVELVFAPHPEAETEAPAAPVRAPAWLIAVLVALAALALAARAFSATVTIDPGHPSEVADGASRQNGTSEVHEAWEVGLQLKALLEQAGVHVVMTKSREREMVRNRRRAEIANQAGSAMMVRLHCDTAAGSGFALYYPDRQGHTQGVTGPEPEIIRGSERAARLLHEGMAPLLAGRLVDGGVRGDSKTFVGGKQGALTGSIFSHVPVVTVEMVVLTNPSDAAMIRTPAGEALMARALARGILGFLKASPDAAPGSPSPSPAGPSSPRPPPSSRR